MRCHYHSAVSGGEPWWQNRLPIENTADRECAGPCTSSVGVCGVASGATAAEWRQRAGTESRDRQVAAGWVLTNFPLCDLRAEATAASTDECPRAWRSAAPRRYTARLAHPASTLSLPVHCCWQPALPIWLISRTPPPKIHYWCFFSFARAVVCDNFLATKARICLFWFIELCMFPVPSIACQTIAQIPLVSSRLDSTRLRVEPMHFGCVELVE